MMSVHSNGGQLFWQPGAYIANGRITTPRPPLGHEAFYWQSASRILSQVRAQRQTVVTPENVGGSSDVLYSSRRQRARGAVLQLRRLRVRLGGRRVGLQHGHRQLPGGLVPAAVGRRPGHRLRPQRDDGVRQRRDGDVPHRRRLGQGQDRGDVDARSTPGQSDSPKGVRFETSEPATIYYTTDGSTPTLAVAALQADRVPRAGREALGRADDHVQVVLGRRRGQPRADPLATVQIGETSAPGGTVPATLSLTLGAARDVRRVHAGRGQGLHGHDAARTSSRRRVTRRCRVSRPGPPGQRHVHAAASRWWSSLSKASWTAPVSNDPVTITFKQHIDANDALRTGQYCKTLTFTLSTTNP